MIRSYVVHHKTNLGRNVQGVILIESIEDDHEAAIPTALLDSDTGEYLSEEQVGQDEVEQMVRKACIIKMGRELVGHVAVIQEDNWTDDGSMEKEAVLIVRSIQGEVELFVLADPIPVNGRPTRHIVVNDMAAQSRGFDSAIDEIMSTTVNRGHVSELIRGSDGGLEQALEEALKR